MATTFAAVALSGCGSDPGRAAVEADLRGRSYEATDAKERNLLAGVRVGVGFADTTMGTYGGCNGTSGYTYAVTGGRLRLSGKASSTLIGCGPDREGQEDWWNDFLQAAPRAFIRDGGKRLELSTSDETVTLVSRPRPEGRRVVPQKRLEQYERELNRLSTNLQVEKDKLRDQIRKGRVTAKQGKAPKAKLQEAYEAKAKRANPFPGQLVTPAAP